MNFVVESNVPMPARKTPPGRTRGKSKYPFADMGVGDSFFIPRQNGKPKDGTISSLCTEWGKRLDARFQWRTVVEPYGQTGEEVAGVRIWRQERAGEDPDPAVGESEAAEPEVAEAGTSVAASAEASVEPAVGKTKTIDVDALVDAAFDDLPGF